MNYENFTTIDVDEFNEMMGRPVPQQQSTETIPISYLELLETSTNNECTANGSFVALDAPAEEYCKCKATCTRGCSCKKSDKKCTEKCSCNKKKCKNKMEKCSVDLDALNIPPVLNDNESDTSDEEPISSDSEESNSDEDFDNNTLKKSMVSCKCKGACVKKCPCRQEKSDCRPSVCACSIRKCSNKKESLIVEQKKKEKKKIRPADLPSLQEKYAETAQNDCLSYCEDLEVEEMRQMMASMALHSPSCWKLVKKQRNNQSDPPPPSSSDLPIWCTCGKCTEMEEERSNICCKNNKKNHENPDFSHLVLDDKVLDLAMRNNSDWIHYPFDPNDNKCWRYTAYRQYIMWFWGHLGKSNRKVIPSCVVMKIRERFPAPDGIYKGFFDNF